MLLPDAVSRVLARFQTGLQSRFGPRLLEFVLFGSYARGTAREDSDVDVLVVVAGLTETERVAVMDLAYDSDAAERESWVGLCPLVFSQAQAAELRSRERLLFRDVDTEGIRL